MLRLFPKWNRLRVLRVWWVWRHRQGRSHWFWGWLKVPVDACWPNWSRYSLLGVWKPNWQLLWSQRKRFPSRLAKRNYSAGCLLDHWFRLCSPARLTYGGHGWSQDVVVELQPVPRFFERAPPIDTWYPYWWGLESGTLGWSPSWIGKRFHGAAKHCLQIVLHWLYWVVRQNLWT